MEPLKEHVDDAKEFVKGKVIISNNQTEHMGKVKGILGFLQRHANALAMFSVFGNDCECIYVTLKAELPSLLTISFTFPTPNFPDFVKFFKWFVFKFTEFTSGYDFGFGLAVTVAILQVIFALFVIR